MDRRPPPGARYQDGRIRVSTFDDHTSGANVDPSSAEQPSQTNYGFVTSFYTGGDPSGATSYNAPPLGSSLRGYQNFPGVAASLNSLTGATFQTDIPSEADVFSYTGNTSQSDETVPQSLRGVFSQFEHSPPTFETLRSTSSSSSRGARHVEGESHAQAESEAGRDDDSAHYHSSPNSTPVLERAINGRGRQSQESDDILLDDSRISLLPEQPVSKFGAKPAEIEILEYDGRPTSYHTLSSSLDTIDEPYDVEPITPKIARAPAPATPPDECVTPTFQTPPPTSRNYRPASASRPASMATVVSEVDVPEGPSFPIVPEVQPAEMPDPSIPEVEVANGQPPELPPRWRDEPREEEPGVTEQTPTADVLNWDLHQLARDGDVRKTRTYLQALRQKRLDDLVEATADGEGRRPEGRVDFIKRKLNGHDRDGLSPLHYAARYNHVRIAELLLDAGAHVDDRDDEDATPLHFAARYSHLRLIVQATSRFFEDEVSADTETGQGAQGHLVTYLIQKGADCNRKEKHGLTPLHFAAIRGNELAARELVALPNILKEEFENQMRTPLHLAVIHKRPRIVEILLDAGVDIRRHHPNDKTTALHLACISGNQTLARMLLDAAFERGGAAGVSAMVNMENSESNKPIHLAAEGRNEKVVALCLERGADVNDLGQNGQRALHFAATSGSLPVVKHLVERGAQLDASDRLHETALDKAAAQNHIKVISYLLNKGAKLKSQGKDNFSPLLIAAYNGHTETVSMLLERGANVFHMDRQERTAIVLAASQDHPDTLQVLLDSPLGTDVLGLADSDGNTALHVAAENGYLDCTQTLLDAGASIDVKNEKGQSPIHLAAENGKFDTVHELLLHNRTVLNATDDRLNTALHLAATAGHHKIVKLLVRAGAEMTAKNTNDHTPLDCAAANGQDRVVEHLIEENAPIESHDNVSPLLLASSQGHPKVTSMLLAKNAKITDVNPMGWNALSLAIDNGHKDVAEEIIASDQWKEAMRNVAPNQETRLRDTPMRKALRKMPELAEKILARCTVVPLDVSPDDAEYFIRYDYEFLDDIFTPWQEPYRKFFKDEFHSRRLLKRNHPLMIMVKEEELDLLNHPLVTALLLHKWRYGSIVFYLNLLVYCIFVIFLTGYMLATPSPFASYSAALLGASGTANDLNDCETIRQFYQVTGPISTAEKVFNRFGRYFILFIVAVELIGELFQLARYKLQYFSYENLLEWTLYVFTILLLINLDQCQRETGIRVGWQWQLGAMAIFLAWMELVLSLRRVPRYGIYIVMFTDVLKTFTRFLPVLFLFVVAFGLAFHALLHNQIEFATVGISFLKTFVMMTGEFELGDVILVNPGNMEYEDQLVLPPAIYIMFTLFVLFMTIIVMNLLIGLAVDDVKGIMETAAIKRWGMQVELALDLENMVPNVFRRRMIARHEVIYPNKCIKNPLRFLLATRNRKGVDILEYITPSIDTSEQLEFRRERMVSQIQEKVESLESSVDSIFTAVRSLQDTQDVLLQMNKKIMEHQGIEWRDETDAELFGI